MNSFDSEYKRSKVSKLSITCTKQRALLKKEVLKLGTDEEPKMFCWVFFSLLCASSVLGYNIDYDLEGIKQFLLLIRPYRHDRPVGFPHCYVEKKTTTHTQLFCKPKTSIMLFGDIAHHL